eukprot:2023776-Prymnesium_polylepis.2
MPELVEAYDVKVIHSMELRDGALWYEVEWDGWLGADGKPELTWEREENLDGCENALAAFYSDPEHRCADCEYGALPSRRCRPAAPPCYPTPGTPTFPR